MRLNNELVRAAIHAAGMRRLTADVYGLVVSTGLQVEGARRGFKRHWPKLPSYSPIGAYEAQTGQLLRLGPFRECARTPREASEISALKISVDRIANRGVAKFKVLTAPRAADLCSRPRLKRVKALCREDAQGVTIA
jgi:hypothetical protein